MGKAGRTQKKSAWNASGGRTSASDAKWPQGKRNQSKGLLHNTLRLFLLAFRMLAESDAERQTSEFFGVVPKKVAPFQRPKKPKKCTETGQARSLEVSVAKFWLGPVRY